MAISCSSSTAAELQEVVDHGVEAGGARLELAAAVVGKIRRHSEFTHFIHFIHFISFAMINHSPMIMKD
jgi:hypothetical protein